jgi:hypothetical protein
MVNWIEKIRVDVNQEDGMILSILSKFTSLLYKGAMFLAIPIILYFLFRIF